jgi:hypothetical protein
LEANNVAGSGASNSHAEVQFYDGSVLGFRFLSSFGNVPSARYGGLIAYQDRDGNKLPVRIFTMDSGGSLQTALFIQAGQASGQSGSVGIGTAVFGENAARVLGIYNGIAPTSSPANMVQLYAEDVANFSELKVRDEAGNVTVLSPHPNNFLNEHVDLSQPFPAVYHSVNEYLGKEIYIDLAAMAEEVEKLAGRKIVYINDIPKRDWEADQVRMEKIREEEISNALLEIQMLEEQIQKTRDEREREELIRQRDAVAVPEPYIKKKMPRWMALRLGKYEAKI